MSYINDIVKRLHIFSINYVEHSTQRVLLANAATLITTLEQQRTDLQRQLAERMEPVTPDWYNCPTNADMWREVANDCDIIDCLADDPVVGMTFDLDVCWNGTQTFRITEVDGSDVEVEMVSGTTLYTSPQVPDGWQPIETAPKDKTRVLVFSEKYGAREARFLCDNSDGSTTWFDCICGGGPMTAFYDATHWMPLPAAPEVKP